MLTDRLALKRLKDIAATKFKEEHPENPFPESCIHQYNPSKANGLTRCIKDFIEFNGGQAERISVTGRMVDNTKVVTDVMGHRRIVGSVSYQKSSMTRGSADISATINGRSVKIEIKIGKDRQSDAQKKYEQSIERAGGIYLIVHTLADFVNWWDSQQTHGDLFS